MNALLAALLSLTLAAPAAAARPAGAATTVLELSGGALTVGERSLQVGDRLPDGKSARLARGGRLVLRAGPWGKILLHGPAVFAAGGEDGADGLRLKAGGLLAVLHKVKGRVFGVRTPAAALAVRGTTFYTETRGQTAQYLCICDGAVELLTPSGAFKATVSSEKTHKSYLFQFHDDNGLQSEAPMERHNDEEIAALAAPR